MDGVVKIDLLIVKFDDEVEGGKEKTDIGRERGFS